MTDTAEEIRAKRFILEDELEALRWYSDRATASPDYFGQDISEEGDVYRVVNGSTGEFVAHFKSKDDAMFFIYARELVPILLVERCQPNELSELEA